MLRCGLIGRSLSHSFSPGIHRMIGGYEYGLYEVEREDLEVFLNKTELDGLNVTIPYKKDVIPLCRELSPRAAEAGSVNTMIRLPGGGWLGENTDYDGFLYMLGPDAEAMRGKKALVLGSGGASAAVCAVLRDAGVPYTVISSREKIRSLQSTRSTDIIKPAGGMYPNNANPGRPENFPVRMVWTLIYTRRGPPAPLREICRQTERLSMWCPGRESGELSGKARWACRSICAGIGAATERYRSRMPGFANRRGHQLSRLQPTCRGHDTS